MKKRSPNNPRKELLFKVFLILLLPVLFLSIQGSAASSAPTHAQAEDEPAEEDSLPQAFKGVANSAALVPFAKTPLEVDPAFPAAIAKADFPDTSFGVGYIAYPGLVAGGSIAGQGIRIPTEVVCSAPGGRPKEEFSAGEMSQASGQIRVGGGTVKTTCSEGPVTVTSAYLYNLVFLSAPASQGAEPPGQIAILGVGFASVISKTTLSSGGLIVETVSELKDVNIGANPAASSYVHFDAIRVEATASSTGEEGGALTTNKVTFAGGRLGVNERIADPEALLKAANAGLLPLGLQVRFGDKRETRDPAGVDAESRATGLIIEAGPTTPQNRPLYEGRKVSLALGVVAANSHLEPNRLEASDEEPGSVIEEATPPGLDVPLEPAPAPELPEGPVATIQPGAGGTYQLALDWSYFKLKSLPADQAAAAWGGVGFLMGALTLLKRRFF